MIEKDNIQELFSKAFENQTAAVKPELWAGVQAKMAVAGVASTATVATKGLSALTKWLIGSAAVGTVGVVATVIALNSGEESVNKKTEAPKEISQNVPAAKPEEHKAEQVVTARTIYTKPNVITEKPLEDIPPVTEPYKEINTDAEPLVKSNPVETTKTKPEEKAPVAANPSKKEPSGNPVPSSENKGSEDAVVKHPENTKEPVFAALEAKVTKFPTIFTPNGDHSNDTYFVTVKNIENFELLIIDQNNGVMFRTNNPGDEWNGMNMAGEEVPNGTYAAIVTGKDQSGKSFRDIQLFELRR